MKWTADVAHGDWIAPRLEGWGVVGATVPRGYEAYVRVFHPVPLDRVRSWSPTIELDERTATWSEITERFATTWHPLMQWQSIARHLGEQFDIGDGWRLNDPPQGRLDPSRLALLAPLLGGATAAPGDLVAGFWHGWGELHPQSAGFFTASTATAGEREEAEREARAELMAGVDPDISRASTTGPTLSLPGREYVLLTTTTTELADPTWVERARLGGSRGSHLSPNLLWPQDRAWFLGTEIDFDSTVVAGSRSLIDAVLATSGLEAAEIEPDASLASDADAINGPPE